MATRSSILTLKIPWTEEPAELWRMRSRSQTRLKQLTAHTYYILLLIQHFACASCSFHNKPTRQVLFSVFVHQ